MPPPLEVVQVCSSWTADYCELYLFSSPSGKVKWHPGLKHLITEVKNYSLDMYSDFLLLMCSLNEKGEARDAETLGIKLFPQGTLVFLM